MKKIICTILIICIVALPFTVSAAYDPDNNVIDGVSVQVFQHNTNYVGWSNHSAVINGSYTLGTLRSPQSLAILNSSTSVLAGYTMRPEDVEITISYPMLGSSQTIYFGVCNTFGIMNSQIQLETYFNWSDSFYGYAPKTGFTGSMGYTLPTNDLESYTVATGSNRTASYKIEVVGTESTGTDWSGNATFTGVGPANINVPQMAVGNGTAYDDFYWMNSGNNLYIYRINITRPTDATNNPWATLRITIPGSALNSVKIKSSASSSHYFHSAVFVPIVVAYDSTSFDSQYITKLDSIITSLGTLDTDISSLGLSLDTIIDLLGSGDITVIEGIESIITQLRLINSAISHLNIIGGGPTGSAIQYIEYYMREVSSNTAYMKNQLADILSTLTLITDTLDDANEQLENTADTIDGQHEIEQGFYDQVNQDIGNIVINNFQFDANTSSGMARAGLDFTALWNSLGAWNTVYTFSMTITVALTIIRYISAKPSRKQTKKESKSDG